MMRVNIFFVACLLSLGGCAEFKMPATLSAFQSTKDPAAKTEDDEPLPDPVVPDRVSAVWSDTILTQHHKPAIRGFGGRIMFYAKDSEEPVVIDGTLTVYAFDDEEGNVENAEPKKRFVFLPEQFAKHRSKSELGHSYSVWLPWDKVGGPQQRVSLFIRFEPTNGGSIMSDASRQVLPGVPVKTETATADELTEPAVNIPAVSQASASSETAGEATVHKVVQAVGSEESTADRFESYLKDKRQQMRGVRQASLVQKAKSSPEPEEKPAKKKMTTVTIDVPNGFVNRALSAPLTTENIEPEMSLQSNIFSEQQGDDRQEAAVTVGNHNVGDEAAMAAVPAQEESEEPVERYSRSGRYVRERSRVRNLRSERPASDQIRRQPHPATWPSDLPMTPR